MLSTILAIVRGIVLAPFRLLRWFGRGVLTIVTSTLWVALAKFFVWAGVAIMLGMLALMML